MARINTNVSSLIAQSNLSKSNKELASRLERLATGLRINRGADDPAGLIASQRLRSELRGLEQGIKNAERASSVISTTEAALSEVSDLLNSVKALVIEAANTGAISKEEIAANQLQIDSAIESISRIANTTSFAGLKLLNGTLGYTVSSLDTSDIVKTKIYGAQLADRANIDVDVEVIGSAQTASLYLRSDFGTVPGAPAADGQLPNDVTLEIAGPDGIVELTFQSATSIDDLIDAINSRSSITGVAAERQNSSDISSGVRIHSVGYGSNSFVSVKRVSGGADISVNKIINDGPGPAVFTGGGANVTVADRDTGKDVVALVNGSVAIGRGLELNVRGPELDMDLLLTSTFATTVSPSGASTFTITGGGAKFQLGPQVNALQQTNIGIDSISATRLGGTLINLLGGGEEVQFLSSVRSGGSNELATGNLANASRILESAIDEISELRGRLGAFERNVLDTNARSLQSGVENISASDSIIRDADFARETSELTRAQILQSAGTSVLAAANSNSQSVLQLLG
ncbi:MAG: flagellin [Planctomycetota bacterium]|nr:flagellin [Planctomycetota bacterium]